MTHPLAPRLSGLTLTEQRRLVEFEIGQAHLDWQTWVDGLDTQVMDTLYGNVGQTPAFFPLSAILKRMDLSFLERGVRLTQWLQAFGHGDELSDEGISGKRPLLVWIEQGIEMTASTFSLQNTHAFFQQKRQFLQTLQAFLDHGAHGLLLDSFSEDDFFESLMLAECAERLNHYPPLKRLVVQKFCQEAWQLMLDHIRDEEIPSLAEKFNDFDDNLLHNACWLGQVWALDALHARQFPLTISNASQQTPLELAIGHEHYHVANWLKAHSPIPPSLTLYDYTILDNRAQFWIRQQQHAEMDVGHALDHFCEDLRLREFQALWQQCAQSNEAKDIFEHVLERLVRVVEHEEPFAPKDARLDYFLNVIPHDWWNDVTLHSRPLRQRVPALEELSKSPSPAVQHLMVEVINLQRQKLDAKLPVVRQRVDAFKPRL